MRKILIGVTSFVAAVSILASPLDARAYSNYYSSYNSVGGTGVTAYVGYDNNVAYSGYNATDYVDAVINGWTYTEGRHFYASFSERSTGYTSIVCSSDIITVFSLVDITASNGSTYRFQLSTDW